MFKTHGEQVRFISDQCYETIPIAFCIYCGEYWQVYDHVPPVSAWCKNTNWAFKYPACKDCNSILSSVPIKDIRVRRYIILKRLCIRYKKLLKMPHWTKVDISELQGYVKRFVKRSKIKKQILLARIDHLCENYKELDIKAW